MATTHALFGAVLAIPTLFFAPEYAPVAFAAGVVGGVFPDLDLYADHRKTLHFPVYYSVAAAVAVGISLLATGPITVALAVFLFAAAFHSTSDAIGGGLELRPWQGTSERAVYNHFRDEWIRSRRWIRYDGAPEDLLLAVCLAVPSVLVYRKPARTAVLALVAVSAVYTLCRKPLVDAAEWLVERIPPRFKGRIPERFIEDLS